MDRLRIARNVAIVALIAAAVQFLPGGGQAANAFGAALWVVFGAGLGYFAYLTYRRRRLTLYSLGERQRAMLYGALALAVFVAAAKPRMWQTSLGELAWFVLLGLSAYVLVAVYRSSRTY
jgi:hypothetical protein